jgi:hypothetical protein
VKYDVLQVLPGLYIGNYRDSKDAAQLERFEITHIVAIHDAARKLHSVSKLSRLELNGHFLYHPAQHSEVLHSVHAVHFCVLYGFQDKQPLVHCTALTDICFYNGGGV